MPSIKLKQESILGGITSTYYQGQKGTYLAGLGIDPDISAGQGTGRIRTSGAIYPVAYSKFSSSGVDTATIAIITPPKNTLVYAILSNGKIVSYTSLLASETAVGTVAGSTAYGAFYYNNYIYVTGTGASHDDVTRYGPLAGGAGANIINSIWKTAAPMTATGAGLGLTPLVDTTYPTIRQIPIPQHWGCTHVDGAAYFLDYKAGQGLVHKIKTKADGGGIEGAVDDGSAYNVLDLPFGYYPTCIQSYGNDLAITAIQTSDSSSVLRQGNAALFLWDTISDSFYRQIPLPDVYATAMLNANGRVYLFTGSNSGSRVSVFNGGPETQQVLFFEDGISPLAGSVDSYGDRIVFGGSTAYPTDTGAVFAFGSKDNNIPTALHCVARATSTGSTPAVTAVKFVQQSSGAVPKFIMGWKDNSASGIDNFGSNNNFNSNQPIWRSQMFQIGTKFKIKQIKIPCATTTATTTKEITVRVWVDDESASYTLNGQNGNRVLLYKRPELAIIGMNNFFISLEWLGTLPVPIELPIEIEVETFSNQKAS